MSTFLGTLAGVRLRGVTEPSASGLPELEEEAGDSCVHVEVEDEDEANDELPVASVGEPDPH